MFRLITIVVLSSILASCGSGIHITVRQDGSALVKLYQDFYTTDINRYYRSDIISNIDTSLGLPVTFEISNIDSIGNYFPYHPPGFFRFNMDGNTLTVTEGHTNAFNFKSSFCCGVTIQIKFDKDIQSIESVNNIARKKDKRTILINKTRRQLIKGKKKTDVTIKIK